MQIYNRKSIRLKNYDYSTDGYYFITICTYQREPYFDNDNAKQIINKYWYKLYDKFNNVKLDEFVIMPDHIHGIIVLENKIVEADPCVCPKNIELDYDVGEHVGSPLPKIIQWYKTMTTNEYIKCVNNNVLKPFNKKLWQRGFYEHVIRNDYELNLIRKYVIYNPIRVNEE